MGGVSGRQYNPFDGDRDHKYIGAFGGPRIAREVALRPRGHPEAAENNTSKTSRLKQLETLRRDIDQSGSMETRDK